KLKQIAKNDSDPQIRSAALRSLYSVDNRLYLDTLPQGKRIGMLDGDFNFNHNFKVDTPQAFEFDSKQCQFDAKRWEEMQHYWQEQWKQNQEKYKELIDKLQLKGMDELRIEM